MAIDKVGAENFYRDRGDKIKQNWFLYEYSNVLFSKIAESPALANYRKNHKEESVAEFCVYYAKRLRQSIFDASMGKGKGVGINARYICEFYPGSTRAQTRRLLEAAFDAWREHIQACAHCPNQCVQDGFEPTGMFDSLEKTGWPTA
jgi:hypothetical protein